jgi:hypothetical protein
MSKSGSKLLIILPPPFLFPIYQNPVSCGGGSYITGMGVVFK